MKLYREFESQAALDAQYDVDGITPEFPQIVQKLLDKSEEARSTLPCRLDVPYGPTRAETLDVFPSVDAPDNAPVLVFFHGGYWRMLSAKEFHFVALGLARAGVTVVIPTHALCPEVSITEIVRQARAATAWTVRHLRDLDAEGAPIFVGGHSAGAHLSLMTLLTDWERVYGLPNDFIAGGIALSGLYDLRALPFTGVGPSLQLTTDQILKNSPLLLDLPDRAPPVLFSYGERETAEFQRHTDSMLARWRAHDLPAEIVHQPGRNHFTAMMDLMEPNAPLTQLIASFVGAPR